jgi:ATP-binding cassette subfamily C (CFTR/MRP) protein 4
VLLFRKLFNLRMILGAKVDSRIRLLSDTINGIRAIKMFAWEKPFAKLIDHARKLSFVLFFVEKTSKYLFLVKK